MRSSMLEGFVQWFLWFHVIQVEVWGRITYHQSEVSFDIAVNLGTKESLMILI